MDHQTANWDHCLEYASLSDIGLRRSNNQDAHAVVIAGSQQAWQQRGHLFAVADGMGAHAAGELASKLAMDTLALTYTKLLDKSPPEAILAALADANRQIHSRGQIDDFKGMGTTASVLLLLPQGALVAHIGDSRIYRLRQGKIEQLTFDHSLVWEMRAAGQISPNAPPDFIPKNVITRCLGPNLTAQVDLEGPFPIEQDDMFLVCCDGLSGQVSDEEIGTVMRCLPPGEAVQALIHLANLRGGPDNITVIVVHVTGPQVAEQGGETTAAPPPPAKTQPVNPIVWIALGVSALGAIGSFAMGYVLPALVFVIAAFVAFVFAMLERYSDTEPRIQFDGRPLGKGPYTASMCPVSNKFVEKTTEIVDQLRKAARDGKWDVNWKLFNSFVERGKSAEKSNHYSQAIAEYFRAISFMMVELKKVHRAEEEGKVQL